MEDAVSRAFESLCREVALAVDPHGRIVALDERAQRRLGARVGDDLLALAPAGERANVARLLERACRGPVDGWEAVLALDDKPLPVSFRGAPFGRGAALVGVPVTVGLRSVQRAEQKLADAEETRDALSAEQGENARLNERLDDARRGIAVLRRELDSRSEELLEAQERCARMLGALSHELRTPVNALVGLVRLLLDEADGSLNTEQHKQLGFALRSAEALSQLLTTLLDRSRFDKRQQPLRIHRFTVEEVFSALRGVLPRPLPGVRLAFEASAGLPVLETDEPRLAQLLRHLVTNALKFTRRGQVRVVATAGEPGRVSLSVEDTGVGIAEQDLPRLFEGLAAVDNPLQQQAGGLGLGLATARQLAVLLAGELTLSSRPGQGTTCTVTLPAVHPEAAEMRALVERSRVVEPGRTPVLVLEDDRTTMLVYDRCLTAAGFQVLPARTVEQARAQLEARRPAAVVLDVLLEGENSWGFLADLKRSPETADIPVVVVTVTNREEQARSLGADAFLTKPLEPQLLVARLDALARPAPPRRVLVVDDDEVSRYLLQKALAASRYTLLEARCGAEGLARAHEERPDVIVLDYVLPDLAPLAVLDALARDPETRDIPVVLNTARTLAPDERAKFEARCAAVVRKDGLAREATLEVLDLAVTTADRARRSA